MRVRSPRYMALMATSAFLLGLSVFFGFDIVADLIGLSKGASFGWAFAIVFGIAVLAVGAMIDALMLFGSCVLKWAGAHG